VPIPAPPPELAVYAGERHGDDTGAGYLDADRTVITDELPQIGRPDGHYQLIYAPSVFTRLARAGRAGCSRRTACSTTTASCP
jgi:hypothetical protein